MTKTKTSAVGAQVGPDKSGLRVVRVLNKTIEHEYYAMEDIPKNVDLTDEIAPASWSYKYSKKDLLARKLLRRLARYAFCGCI